MNFIRIARLAALGGLVLAAAGANAQSLDEAKSAFAEGRFSTPPASRSGRDSEGFALAARALAGCTGTMRPPRKTGRSCSNGPCGWGRRRCAPTAPIRRGYFQSGHALGRYAQSIGTMTALRKGLGGKTREMFEATLALDPDHALAHLALGGWNADIVDRAGGLPARVMYGATKKKAVAHFERALELAPDSKVVLLDYALRLPKLDKKKGRERAQELMSKAVGLPVGDVYGGFVHERAVAELKGMEGE